MVVSESVVVEGVRQKLLSLSLLLLPCVLPMLEVSESSLKVLAIILKKINMKFCILSFVMWLLAGQNL